MSIEGIKLNSPQVVGVLSVTCFASMPFLKGKFEKPSIPWTLVQGVNLCAFAFSFYSVTQPTREGQQSKKDDDVPKILSSKGDTNKSKKKKAVAPRLRTLLPPDGWSFVIWAPIFVGETLMVGTQMALSEKSAIAPIVREVTGPYLFAKAFQILWNTSFKPEFQEGYYKYIAPLNLSGLALSLSFCHKAYADKSAREKYGAVDFFLNFLPLSLHFGWTSFTCLVNWNAAIAVDKEIPTKYIEYLGNASAAIATLAGVGVTLMRQAPLYGTVMTWSLTAISSGLSKRIEGIGAGKEDEYIAASKRQRNFAQVGAALCAGATLLAASGKATNVQR